jgi:anthranilate synthase/aminodeoxychorismate synthase-like glutamine amidotransferase
MTARVLIADNYDSFTYNLAQAFGALGARVDVVRSDKIDLEQTTSDPPDALVISPGPGRPEKAGNSLALIARLSGRIPILGVCLGHQAIGAAFGGKVVAAPSILHGKTSRITHDGGPLFDGVRNGFRATRYHSLVVDDASLAATLLRPIARSDDGVLMGIAHRQHSTFGLQFHPESVLTTLGPRMLANFLALADRSS